MKRKKLSVPILAFALLALLALAVLAEEVERNGPDPWISINAGGQVSGDSTHQGGISIGQSVVGVAAGSSFAVSLGFWPMPLAPPPPPPPEVVSTTPAANELSVDGSTDISVTFDIDMDESSINDNAFIVYGNLTGLHPGAIAYVGGTKSATLDPSQDFHNGEIVSVMLTNAVRSAEDAKMTGGYAWTFTVKTDSSAGVLSVDSTYPTCSDPRSVIAADLNNDGFLDLLVTCSLCDSVAVYLNNGSGGFAERVEYAVGHYPVSIATADFDADTFLDFATANRSTDSVSVLFNQGDGSFGSRVDYQTGDSPNSIRPADVDADGDLDLIIAVRGSDNVCVFENDGSGTFAILDCWPVGDNQIDVAVGDFSGDGNLDLAVARLSEMVVLMGDGNGGFQPDDSYTLNYAVTSIAANDLDGDHDLDLAITSATYPFKSDELLLSVFKNDGDGKFTESHEFDIGGQEPACLCIPDIDGDGDIDVITANAGSGGVSVLLNDGTSIFTVDSTFATGNGPYGVFAADLDNDGFSDVIAAELQMDNIVVLWHEPAVEPCKCGDADNNGIWNISDAVRLIDYIFGGGPPPDRPCLGDCDGNSLVNISDAVYMITYIFGGGPEPGGCDPAQEW